MKKLVLAVAIASLTSTLFAYNPPFGGQSLYNLSSPIQLTSASSAAGGGIFSPGPDSIAFNPALTAMEDRVQLDLDFSALISTDDQSLGSAWQTGILIPTKMFIVSGLLNGVMYDKDDMDLGESLNFKAGLAKSVTDRLSVGINMDAGAMWNAGSDWALGCDLGVLYRREELKFFKDFRIGVSALNLGKYYSPDLVGLNDEDKADSFPSIATLRLGTAANVFQTKDFLGGASFDMSFPTFQDAVFDLGFQFAVKDVFFINIAETIDVQEIANDHASLVPAIGIGVKFNLKANNAYMASHSWESSEMKVSAAWQQKYDTVQVISGGANLKLGQKDTEGPSIQLWNE